MKISEFAIMNNVSTKMLRHYDEIGLLKPISIDHCTGYRCYEESQSLRLGWILILKNLDFSLQQIQELLENVVDCERFIQELKRKRIEISLEMNEQYQKQIQINKLIGILEREGFDLDKSIHLMDFDLENVNELKKNMPTMERFLESVESILANTNEEELVAFIRFDICQFKRVNDEYGYTVGDRVILICYNIIMECVAELRGKATVGRMGGDEFAVFLTGNEETVRACCTRIAEGVTGNDFSMAGCPKRVSCYIGALCGNRMPLNRMRWLLDQTLEVMREAHDVGPGTIRIQSY